MPAAIARMPVGIGKEGQERPLRMCCRPAFVRYAITGTSAMPLELATDPLEIGKVSSTHKRLKATAAMNRTLLKDSPECLWLGRALTK